MILYMCVTYIHSPTEGAVHSDCVLHLPIWSKVHVYSIKHCPFNTRIFVITCNVLICLNWLRSRTHYLSNEYRASTSTVQPCFLERRLLYIYNKNSTVICPVYTDVLILGHDILRELEIFRTASRNKGREQLPDILQYS